MAAALRELDSSSTLILDGEIAVYDRQLVSRFEWLRHSVPPELATPPLFMVFDCLDARGKDLRERPLSIRRHVLEGEVDGHRLILPARRLADEELTAWAEVLARGYEALVAKDPASPYVGGRTLKWLKVNGRATAKASAGGGRSGSGPALPEGAARRGGLNRSPGASTVGLAMLRTMMLAGALLAAVAAPAHAGGHGGGHGGRGFHGHHGGFRHHHHGFHSFVGVGVFAPWPWYPYDYPYYPYPYNYPYAYPPPVVVEPPPVVYQAPTVQREVVYPTGKYVLHGDGINYPWQWVWIPAAPPPPPPPAP